GIISNTLNLKAPSTTDIDIEMHDWLMDISFLNRESYREQFDKKSVVNEPIKEFLFKNQKTFEINKISVCVVQIETINPTLILDFNELNSILEDIQRQSDSEHIFLSVVNILEGKTKIHCTNEATLSIAKKAFSNYGFDDSFTINKILLRKTDIIPRLKTYFS